MKHTVKKIIKAGIGMLAAAGVFMSCEIGLGASVDTDRPTIEITYPPRNSVIRDGFVLAGKAGDDRGLAKVVITATNSTTGARITREVPAAGLSEEWSVGLNDAGSDGKYEMSDGKYTIDAEAYDLDGKSSGAASITVEVDNTAPFFIANKPGSSKSSNPSPYGSTMTVTGVIAEDHDVSVMEMKVYSLNDDGSIGDEITEEKGFVEENVQTAGGISVKFADINAESGSLLERYRKMYTKGEGTESYAAEFILTDSAKVYKNPKETENKSTGNSTEKFYLADDLTPLTAAAGLGMNAAEIKSVVNGTSGESESKKTQVIERLNAKARTDAYFSLNPANNPTFNIGSSSYADGSDKSGITATANKGITLSVQYSAGRDNVALEPSSLRLYLAGPVTEEEYTASYGDEIFAADRWLDVKKEEAKEGEDTYTKYTYALKEPSGNSHFKGIADKVTELHNKKEKFYLDSSDTGLNYEYVLDAEITAGKYYFLVAVGEDKDGNHIKCAEGYYYGFKAQSSGTPPTVEIGGKVNAYTNPLNSGITNSKKIVFSGKASIDGATIKDVKYKVSLKKGTGTTVEDEYDNVTFTKTADTEWNFEYEPGFEEGNVYTAEFIIWAVDSGSRRSSDVFRSVTVDLIKPEISISSVTPEVAYDGKTCVNGEVKVNLNAGDETKFRNWTGKAYAGSEADGQLIKKETKSNTNGVFDFDTSAYDKQNLILVLEAEDEAGNTNIIRETSYYIDQDSDKPVIDVSASVKVDLLEEAIGDDNNLFTISGSSAGSISATVTDDDGVAEIKAEYSKKNGGSYGSWTEFYKVTGLTADTITKSIPLQASAGVPLDTGIYKIRITATDKVKGVTGKTKEFYIGITRGRPQVKISSQSGLWHKAGETVSISGSGDTTITKLERQYKVGGGSYSAWEEVSWTSGSITDSITVPEATKTGTVSVKYRGTDSYGQTGDEAEFTYNIDGNAPSLTSNVTWGDGKTISGTAYENENSVKVTATATEGSGESGVESKAFIISENADLSDAEKKDGALWNVISGGDRTVSVGEGTHYVYVRAVDKAGNETYKAGVKVMSDTSKPVVAVTEPVYYQNGSADLTMTGNASDNVGLDAAEAVKVYVNGNIKKTYTAAQVKGGIAYTLTKEEIKALPEGESEIEFVAKDVSGKTESQIVKIKYDVKGPALTVTSPDNFDAWISSAKTSISGTADDASKIDAVYWTQNAGAAAGGTWSGWKKATGTTAWKIEDLALSEGNNTLILSAVDEHGNVTEKITKTLKSDQNKPEVTLEACKVGGNAEDISGEIILKSSSFVLEGNFSDSASDVTVTAVRSGSAVTPAYTKAKSGKWSISESGLSDGTYTYEITATDESGRTAGVNRSVTVDTTAPVYKSMTVGEYAYAERQWSASGSFTLTGTWTEEGSGIEKLEYWILPTDADPSEAADGTITPAKTADGWTFRQNFNFENGVNYFCVRPTDKAGNTGAYKHFNLNVDTKAPQLEIYNGKGKDESDNDISILDNIIYRKDSGKFTVSGRLSDDVSYINAWYAIRIFAGDYDVNYKDWENNAVTTPKGQVALIGSLHNCSAKGCSHTEAQKQNLQEKEGTFEVEINVSDLPKDSKGKLLSQYVITVVGEDYKENRIVKSFTLNIDGEPPIIEVNSIAKLIEAKVGSEQKTNNVNGTVTVQGVTTDNDKVESFSLALYNESDDPTHGTDLAGTAVTEASGSSASKWKYEIDTTELTDKKTYVLVMTAYDRTGNPGTASAEIYVNQATDLPSYASSNAELKAATDTTAGLVTARAKKNLFGMGNIKINGTVSDDDGVGKIEWTITGKKADGTSYTSGKQSKAGSRKTSEDFSVTIPSELNGEASLSVTVEDINGKTRTFTVPFVFDDSAPSIVPHQVNGVTYSENMFVKGTFNIEFAASDTNGIEKVVEINKATKVQIGDALTETSDGSGIWRQSATENTNLDTAKTRTYQVTDSYGRTAETSISYKVDVQNPVLTAGNFRISGGDSGEKTESQLADFWFRSESVTVKNVDGKEIVSDANLKSNVSYSVSGATTDSGSFDMTVTNGKGTMNNNRAVSNGTSTVTYVFSDMAGNSVSKAFTVKVDNKAPQVSAKSLKAGSTDLSAGTVTNAGTITAGFTVSDETSGLKEAYIALKSGFDQTDAGDYLTKITLTGSSATKTYSINTSSMEEGSYEVWLRVLDNAGNSTGDTRIGSFVLDNEAPAVSFNAVFDADSVKEGNQVNKTISISGTVSDSHLASGAVPAFYVDSNTTDQIGKNTYAESGKTVTASRSGNGWTVSGIDTTKLTKGSHIFKVCFTDTAGNTTSSGNTVTVDVDQNTDRPVITLNTVNHDGSTTLNNGGLAGSISDDDGAISKFEIAVTGGTAPAAGDWKEKTLDGSSWSHEVTQLAGRTTLDGGYSIWFRVKDANNTTFTTALYAENATPDAKAEADLGMPAFSYQGSVKASGEPVRFSIDQNPPVIGQVTVQVWDGTKYGAAEEFQSNVYYGGKDKPKAKFTIPVSDTITAAGNLDVAVQLGENTAQKLTYSSGYTYELDFSTVSSGLLLINFTAADKSGYPAKKTYNITVDNGEPLKVSNVTPNAVTEMTGTLTMNGTVNDESSGNSGIRELAYVIPKFISGTAPSDPENLPSGSAWITEKTEDHDSNLTRNSISWSIDFTDLDDGNSGINANYAGWESGDGIYQLPVWFRITDAMGNVKYDTDNSIRYNPNADRPKVTVTYPLNNTDLRDAGGNVILKYVVMGGTVRITGTATDNEGVEAVYLQYDINGDKQFNDTDKTWLSNNGYTVENIPGTSPAQWGIKADGTLSWQAQFSASVLVDSDGYQSLEIGNEGNTGNKTLNIRACAVDNDSVNGRLVSAWSDEVHVSVNNSVPQFSDPFKLAQYSDSTYTTKIRTDIDYEKDMFIRGSNWCLEGDVTDTNGIFSVSLTEDIRAGYETEYGEDGTATGFIQKTGTALSCLTKKTDGYDLKIPLDTSKASFKLMIEAYDNDQGGKKNSTTQVSLYIDNEAPAFQDGANDDTLVLYRDSYGEDKNKLSESVELRNYNSWATIAGKIRETGSGFKRTVFYAERYSGTQSAKTNRRIYNVMEPHTVEGKQAGRANRTDLVASEAVNSVYINDDGLPVLKVNAVRNAADKLTVNLTGIGDNKNIRKNGLVFIGGDYRLITDYTRNSADQITVGIESVDIAETTAYFVYGMVIDHNGESLNADGSVKNDDGDGMVESVFTSGTDTTWDATFDSSNIPDGPVEIHAVVFDNAGNHRHGSVVTRVSNNAPKIARVKLGTDLNGSRSVEDDEFTYFHAVKPNGTPAELTKTVNGKTVANMDAGLSVWDLDSADENGGIKWKIKSGLTVKPEFVGGTGDIYYVFSKALGTGSGTHLEGAATASGLGSATTNTVANGKVVNGIIDLPSSVLDASTGEDAVNTYRFSFWDSTEESVPGSTSGSCVLNAELYQDLTDGTPPVPYIHPFFWKGKGKGTSAVPNNSIQWTDADGDKESEAMGHIELEKDWLSASGYSSTAETGYQDKDPKVSGKIVLRGSVYDETRLTEVKVVSSDSAILGAAAGLTATYTPGTGTWSSPSGTGYKLTVKDMKVSGASGKGPSQRGHLVEWTLEVDTEKVTKAAKTDVSFTVTGKDGTAYSAAAADTVQTEFGDAKLYATAGQADNGKFYATAEEAEDETGDPVDTLNKSPFMTGYAAGSDTIGEYSTGTASRYRMDIVPYVTDVVTSLTAKDGNAKGKYSRSSLGHYPVRSIVSNNNNGNYDTTSETVTLKGFNLNETGAAVAVTGITTVTKTATTSADGVTGKYKLSFSAAELKSRALTATVNSIPLMNNVNNNNARGQCTSDGTAFANCYNRLPNGDNNNNLNDDIFFDVWEFNDRVARPVRKSLGGTVMKVNSHNNLIQYAFSDGRYFRYPTTTASSQNQNAAYDTFQTPSIGLHVDADGYAVASGHSSDTNSSGRIDFLRFAYSRWGVGNNGDYDKKDNLLVLEGTGDAEAEQPGKDKTYIERQRIWSPSFASSSGKMYMAYYDLLTKQIRFRAGSIGTTKAAFGMFNNDQKGSTNNANVQVVANADISATTTLANNDRGSGKFVSIAASQYTESGATKDAVSMVWFDSINGALRYSYIQDPIGNINTIKGNKTAVNWSTPETINIPGGQYCQIAAAEDGTIHVAAYGDDGYLYYAYANNYTGGFNVVCVDATDDVGQNLTLDVALKNVSATATASYKAIPYIGYLSSEGYPKYAYLTDAAARGDAGTSKAGVQNYRFTGNWEVTTVPTGNALFINFEDHINVGVWKTTAAASGVPKGTLKASGTGTTTIETVIEYGTTTNEVNYTYGNGTSNGVLVYQVVDKSGSFTNVLESAQLRAAE